MSRSVSVLESSERDEGSGLKLVPENPHHYTAARPGSKQQKEDVDSYRDIACAAIFDAFLPPSDDEGSARIHPISSPDPNGVGATSWGHCQFARSRTRKIAKFGLYKYWQGPL
jgi:hypothetical protein